jgi:uncharacterized protein (TIGR04255 family)
MNRSLPALRLSKSPLVLVLCQVRLAAIRNMATYIPKVQDRLRRQGFPVDVSREVQEFGIQDGQPMARRQPHWEFRTKDERSSVIVREQAVVLQTSDYSNFDAFLDRLLLATDTVNEVVQDLVVERVGLRYLDLIRPEDGESWRDYVQSGFHGIVNRIVESDKSVVFTQTTTQTGENSRLILRLAQNRDRVVLPPDLLSHAPAHDVIPRDQELLTLLDLDHYHEERVDYSRGFVDEKAWVLHDALDVLFRDVVTPHALRVWK